MRSRRNNQRGSALLTVMVIIVMITGVSGALFTAAMVDANQTERARYGMQAMYIAESAAVKNFTALNTGSPGFFEGKFASGDYTVRLEDWGGDGLDNDGDGVTDNEAEANFMRVVATGVYAGQERSVEVILSRQGGGVYWNAIFAGNSSMDPNYTLGFGGFGTGKKGQADDITGDVYSGNDIAVTDDAVIKADQVMASGTCTGWPGWTQGVQSIPDLQAMGYEGIADFKVKDTFDSKGYYTYDDAGGNAWQVPQEDPNHIFRKNPSDRKSDIDKTEKDDYFLEDPYQPVRIDPNQNGSDAYHIKLNQDKQNPDNDGNNKIYYIDGNLWIHNRLSYSFVWKHSETDGINVTFVVKGNIYYSDNLFYNNKVKDGVAFIAMKDPEVPDSGNIYFGDPVFGTLEQMHAFMYAENNFYDNNLDAAGSKHVYLHGNMTAGNQVLINRDYGNQHSKLEVEFDDRVKTGKINIPGLPGQPGAGAGAWNIVSWREITRAEADAVGAPAN